ncbi:MAG TPA: amidohydrolase family protein [Candidatus Acidoferrales bacterium]|jgi:predicted TIM-barrel fold metal-dependent hydrolase|nr:amidohydrolase family protein [Candidatus Acidoferrales bacterium]
MTIDIHPHVISTDIQRYSNAPVGGHKSDWSRERPVSVEQMIVAMDQAGIAKSALVQASTCYGHDNSYIADAVAAHPTRFTGVFSVDVLAPDAPEKIRYWVGRNLTGMRLFTAGSTMPNQADWVDDPRSFPAWECASELGIPVCVQMTVKAIPQLVRMLERFPKVRAILDHLAKPTLSDGPPYAAAAAVFELANYKNLYLKLTPRTAAEAQNGKATLATFFPLLVSKFGASRIAWGSNYPASEGTLSELLTVCQSALSVLSAEDHDWIFAKTALTLYPALAGK